MSSLSGLPSAFIKSNLSLSITPEPDQNTPYVSGLSTAADAIGAITDAVSKSTNADTIIVFKELFFSNRFISYTFSILIYIVRV